MNYLNSILLEGELSDAPTFTTTANGLDRCSFFIASGEPPPWRLITEYQPPWQEAVRSSISRATSMRFW